MADATPRPSHNKRKAKQPLLLPIAESTEDQIDDPDFDETPVAPVAYENSVTEDESASLLTEEESEIEYNSSCQKKKGHSHEG